MAGETFETGVLSKSKGHFQRRRPRAGIRMSVRHNSPGAFLIYSRRDLAAF
jgi:hypothetical protein